MGRNRRLEVRLPQSLLLVLGTPVVSCSEADPASKVSVTFGSQVSWRLRYCKRDEI